MQKSDYFAAMFQSNMRESLESVFQVPNCSKAAFLCVLEDSFNVSIDDVVGLNRYVSFGRAEVHLYGRIGTGFV